MHSHPFTEQPSRREALDKSYLPQSQASNGGYAQKRGVQHSGGCTERDILYPSDTAEPRSIVHFGLPLK